MPEACRWELEKISLICRVRIKVKMIKFKIQSAEGSEAKSGHNKPNQRSI